MTPHQEGAQREPYSTQRVEAFSDGVFAIAVTLLILDVRVPRGLPETTRLIDALLANWPSYFAFLTSFATIGIMWVNHHRLFGCIARADHGLLIWNGLLLLGITFVPFPTALIAEYIGHPDERTAAMVLGGTYVFLALMFNGLWWHAARGRRLLGESVDEAGVRAISRSYAIGPAAYLATFLLALVNATASLGLNLFLAVFYALPARLLPRLFR